MKQTIIGTPTPTGAYVDNPRAASSGDNPRRGQPTRLGATDTRDDGRTREPIIAPTRLFPGATIPGTRLRVDAWLGEGATAVVYRGAHIELGRQLAIKVLRRAPQDEAARERFLDEAKVTADLRSAFLPDIVDFGTLPDGRLYYAMELARGRTVATLLDEGPLEVRRVVAILRMACKAMAVAHEAGVVHRDLKPENMVVEATRGAEHLMVLDFGIAAQAGDISARICGTPQYMAPEQVRGEAADGRADIYALGCCAYEMLWGEDFATGDSPEAVLAHQLDPPRFDPPHRTAVHAELREVVRRCLALAPEDRYANVAELEAAICEAQMAASLRCSTDELAPPAVDETRRSAIASTLIAGRHRGSIRRWTTAAVAAVMLLLAGGLWLAARQEDRTQAEAQITAIVERARASGARGVFVYPLPEQEMSTAYATVRALEDWSGPGRDEALRQARQLRTEMANALVQLGDSAWDDPQTRGYSRDFYAQALVFVPEDGGVRQRVGLTTGELAELRHKAETDDFSAAELETHEVLIELSHPETLTVDKTKPARPDTADVVVAAAPRATPVASTVLPDPDDAQRRETAADDSPSTRDPSASRRLARRGRRALAGGDRSESRNLFEQAIAFDHENASAYAGLADSYFEDGQHERALHFARMAARRNTKSPDHLIRLGDSYLRVGRTQEARVQYARAVALGSTTAKSRLRQVGE